MAGVVVMRFTRVLLSSAAALVLTMQVSAQAVISAHSGVVHFSEGSVFIDDHPLDHKVATFPNIKEGSTLRTEKGRAEVLLTPGVFLRLDENSAIRMKSDSLSDTQVEFLRGAAIVDSLDALADSHVVVLYKDTQVRFPKQGVYRLDYETGTLQAYSGEAEVTHEGKTAKVDESHLYFFTLDLDTKKLGDGTDDEFYGWAKERSEAISAENQLAAQTSADPADSDGSDPNALAGDPNFGLPNSGVPNMGVPNAGVPNIGVPNYPTYGYNYPMNSFLFDPFSAYAVGAPYFPFPAPLIVLVRPYRYPGTRAGWPGTTTSTWSRTSPTWPHTGSTWRYPALNSGYHSVYTGVPHTFVPRVPMVHPTYTPIRPISRPAYAAHPAPVPAAVHAIGHR